MMVADPSDRSDPARNSRDSDDLARHRADLVTDVQQEVDDERDSHARDTDPTRQQALNVRLDDLGDAARRDDG